NFFHAHVRERKGDWPRVGFRTCPCAQRGSVCRSSSCADFGVGGVYTSALSRGRPKGGRPAQIAPKRGRCRFPIFSRVLMGEQGRLRRDQDSPIPGEGGAVVRTPSGGAGSSSSDLPPPSSDAPTIAPLSEVSGSDAPTLVPPSQVSPSDSPTIADRVSPTPRRTSRVQSVFQQQQPVLETGFVLAQRYEIEQTLGEGGMGAVYKAKDLELDRLVALKVIRPELARNPAIIDRFKQELLLSQRVTHRNVIRIYDLGEGDGVKFITMEFIVGQDLRHLIHTRKKFSPEEAVDVMEQICLALDAAHSVDVIHRDLKPQNVMVDTTGRVLVMDFGLARTLEGEGMTQTGALVGTMEYMSPEQAL